MMGKTHMAFSGGVCGLTWVAIAQPTSPIDVGVMVAATTFGGLLPDIDHPQASISRKNVLFGALSRIISAFPWGKHRRVVHTLPVCIIFGAIGYLMTMLFGGLMSTVVDRAGMDISIANGDVQNMAMLIGMGFLIGSAGHLIADTCNKEGIMWLWPFSQKRISIMPITTSSALETLFLVATSVGTVALAATLIRMGILSDMGLSNIQLPRL